MFERTFGRIAMVVLALGLIFAYFALDLGRFLSLEALRTQHLALRHLFERSPLLMGASFAGVYIATTGLSLPGAAVLTLAGGAIFGFGVGLVLVSISSTIGATVAFLGSRYLAREWVQRTFGDRLASVNGGVEKEGSYYLLTLRLVPIFPFFLVNLLMGLTPIRIGRYFLVSWLGMLPGAAVYVNAGTRLAELESLRGIFSGGMLASFALIGLLPLVSKRAIGALRSRRKPATLEKPGGQ